MNKTFALVSLLACTSFGCAKVQEADIKKNELVGEEVTVLDNIFAAPKIDILLAQGNTDTLKGPNDDIIKLAPAWINTLNNEGWNIHFTSVTLNTPTVNGNREIPITQVAASRQDPNWESGWMTEYPGLTRQATVGITPTLFRKPLEYTAFVDSANRPPHIDDKTNGLDVIYATLTAKTADTGFFRNDSLLAVLVVSSQEDTSGTNICTATDGQILPCDNTEADKSKAAASLNSYKTRFPALKSNPKLFQFFAHVPLQTGTCLNGGKATAGKRYTQMVQATATRFSEKTEAVADVCNISTQQFLQSTLTALDQQRAKMETHFLFLGEEAAPDTIEVYKNPGAETSKAVKIPKDPTNGWTYAGKIESDQAKTMIATPEAAINVGSGYAIELHGSAALLGKDTARVVFQTPAQFAKKPRLTQL